MKTARKHAVPFFAIATYIYPTKLPSSVCLAMSALEPAFAILSALVLGKEVCYIIGKCIFLRRYCILHVLQVHKV